MNKKKNDGDKYKKNKRVQKSIFKIFKKIFLNAQK